MGGGREPEPERQRVPVEVRRHLSKLPWLGDRSQQVVRLRTSSRPCSHDAAAADGTSDARGHRMTDDMQIRTFPEQTVLVVSKRVKAADIKSAMGDAFRALMRHVTSSGARVVGAPFSLYPELPGAEISFLVGLPVAAGAVGAPGVELQTLPATEAATVVYQGPYDAMEPTWRGLLAWVEQHGRRPAGPMREVYLNDPATAVPAMLRTQLVVPLA